MRDVRPFADWPLHRKLVLQVAAAALLAMLIGATWLFAFDLTTFRPVALSEARAQLDSIAQALRPSVVKGDHEEAQRYLLGFGTQPGVRALSIVGADGQIFAAHRRPGVGEAAMQVHGGGSLPSDVVEVLSPIVEGGRQLAEVHMIKDLRPFRSRLGPLAAALAAAALSLTALAAMMSMTIRRSILEPVRALASAARQVTERRDYSRRVYVERRDEIGELAREFNAMLTAIEERSHALEQSEETTRRQLAEIENIYQNAGVGLCLLDRDLRFVRINKRLADMNGLPAEACIGKRGSEIVPEIAELIDPQYRRIIETGEPLVVELQAVSPVTNQMRYCVSSNYPLRDSTGEIIGINSVVMDLTERKLAEEERARLEAQLRQSQKMQALGTLAGGIAHDFNNVLTAIDGNARLALQDLAQNHPAAVSVVEISRGAQRAKDLVRRILTFSRQEQNDRKPIDLAPVCEEALRLLRATLPQMIEIQFEAAPALPQVLADATQVHQMLMNLGANALDAMRERGGVLSVRVASVAVDSRLQAVSTDLKRGAYVRVSVEDTGCGIDPATMERMFEPFFTTKPPGRGTGLGLSAVHGIMRAHEGAVTASSEVGRGSVFDLYFPALAAAVGAPPELADGPAPAGAGEHILYVDDEEPLVFLVTRMLERMGYQVTGMTRASDAIAAVLDAPGRFDIVISDLGMPGMSGLDLAERLLSIRPDLPVIITSGHVRPEDTRRAEQIGVRDIVLKPGTVTEIASIIRRRLSELRAREAARSVQSRIA